MAYKHTDAKGDGGPGSPVFDAVRQAQESHSGNGYGHDIVGVVRRVESDVREFKAGYIGVGPTVWSCGDFSSCKKDKERYCPDLVDTYNFEYKDGSRSWSGYSDFVRDNEQFVFSVSHSLPPAMVAPFFCAGLAVFSSLKEAGVGPGTRVGVIGIGGLGHYAVIFAHAMDATVTAILHSARKKQDA
ncbi:hypothetical protein SBRCBS47491_001631 [Sporothrix bragantina]|uniref:Alcohol dehydrogenase-like N-terminal domain-containing protein n=1 Tax=Sporothrix bragantina TaxID=671064 RepID=A0ABP0B053_9PEZI